ncbi:MAG: hypothetical protein CMO81_00570 [Waddliaceae bacterium]|nr:hypothetical protein [Waddliaceae bacterium]
MTGLVVLPTPGSIALGLAYDFKDKLFSATSSVRRAMPPIPPPPTSAQFKNGVTKSLSWYQKAWKYSVRIIAITKNIFKIIAAVSLKAAGALGKAGAALGILSIVGLPSRGMKLFKNVVEGFKSVSLHDFEMLAKSMITVANTTLEAVRDVLAIISSVGFLSAKTSLMALGTVVVWMTGIASIIELFLDTWVLSRRSQLLFNHYQHFGREGGLDGDLKKASNQLKQYLEKTIAVSTEERKKIEEKTFISLKSGQHIKPSELRKKINANVLRLEEKRCRHFSRYTSANMLAEAKKAYELVKEGKQLSDYNKLASENFVRNIRTATWRRLAVDGSKITANVVAVTAFICALAVPMAPFTALIVGVVTGISKSVFQLFANVVDDFLVERCLRPVEFQTPIVT